MGAGLAFIIPEITLLKQATLFALYLMITEHPKQGEQMENQFGLDEYLGRIR